jgi:carbamoylphosphate synthase small subunit
MGKSKCTRFVSAMLAALTVLGSVGVVSFADGDQADAPVVNGAGNLSDVISASTYETYSEKYKNDKVGSSVISLDVLNFDEKLTDAEGVEHRYFSLEKAIAAAEDGAVVTLLKDVELTETVTIEKPVTLDLAGYTVTGAVAAVSRREPAVYEPAEGQKYNVTLVDYGVRRSLIDALCARGCRVTVVPPDTDAETILAGQPDGVVLSGGPGDPRENTACIENLKALERPNLRAAIVGKALYDGRTTLKEIKRAAL